MRRHTIAKRSLIAMALLVLPGVLALPLSLPVSGLLGLPAAEAHRDSQHDLARRLKEAGDIQPLETIIAKAKAQHPGRVLEAELNKRGEQYVYEIELVDDKGVVWKLYYDARTGDLLSVNEDN
jgi:uncharacterized iron-regulated membrane protein